MKSSSDKNLITPNSSPKQDLKSGMTLQVKSLQVTSQIISSPSKPRQENQAVTGFAKFSSTTTSAFSLTLLSNTTSSNGKSGSDGGVNGSDGKSVFGSGSIKAFDARDSAGMGKRKETLEEDRDQKKSRYEIQEGKLMFSIPDTLNTFALSLWC